MNYIYGELYRIEQAPDDGACTQCGAPHNNLLFGIYNGCLEGVHYFHIYPFSCIVCRAEIWTCRLFDVEIMNISKELEKIKK